MFEDNHLEMEYEDRFVDSYIEEEEPPYECRECGYDVGHDKECIYNPANRAPIEVYGTPEHEAWLIEMERLEE
jgi:hypothetical protein